MAERCDHGIPVGRPCAQCPTTPGGQPRASAVAESVTPSPDPAEVRAEGRRLLAEVREAHAVDAREDPQSADWIEDAHAAFATHFWLHADLLLFDPPEGDDEHALATAAVYLNSDPPFEEATLLGVALGLLDLARRLPRRSTPPEGVVTLDGKQWRVEADTVWAGDLRRAWLDPVDPEETP